MVSVLLFLAACSSEQPPEPAATTTPEAVSGPTEYLQTARTHFEAGELDEAITFARLPVDLAQSEGARETAGAAGPFTMGSNEDGTEMPPHRVDLPAYYIGKYEVTNEQFRRFVQATEYDAGSEWKKYASKWGTVLL